MVSSGVLELCYDSRILTEYYEVLGRPRFHFHLDHVEALLDEIKAFGHVTAAVPLSKRLPDPDDEVFLEVAIAGRAEYLVTGNLKDYPTPKREGAKVVSPADFIGIYRKRIQP